MEDHPPTPGAEALETGETTRTVTALVRDARERLRRAPFEPSQREAYLLLGNVLGLSEAQIFTRPERPVPADQARVFEDLLRRRLLGEPVAYLLGWKEFFGRPFAVDPRVLIPRPETEHLVEAALARPLPAAPRILDIGTGSGCLAVTLALESPAARLVASDLSPGALAVAARNSREHGVSERVRLVASDLGEALDLRAFDLVVSNPPYIDPEDGPGLSPEVTAFEPADALFAAEHGLRALRRMMESSWRLRPGTPLLCEIGQGQLDAVRATAARCDLRLDSVIEDYAGIPRTVVLVRC